jgi:hypothetical protein
MLWYASALIANEVGDVSGSAAGGVSSGVVLFLVAVAVALALLLTGHYWELPGIIHIK